MRKVFLFLPFLSFALTACPPRQTTNPNQGLVGCNNLPNLNFQDINNDINGTKVTKLAVDLAAAAKMDAQKSANVSLADSANANIKSELSKTVNFHTTESSKVDEEFWKQNIVFTQCACFLESQSKRKDLSKEQRETITTAMIDLVKARSDYSLQFEKKSGKSLQ